MQFHHMLDDRQPQAGAGRFAPQACIHPVKRLEDLLQVGLGNADAVVPDRDYDAPVFVEDVQADLLFPGRVFVGVDEEIQDDLSDRPLVVPDGKRGLDIDGKAGLGRRGHSGKTKNGLFHSRPDGARLHLDDIAVPGGHPPGQNAIDHRVQPFCLLQNQLQAFLGPTRVVPQQTAQERFGVHPNGGQRSAQLMGDIGQQVGLEAGDAGAASQQDYDYDRSADGRRGETDHQDSEEEADRGFSQNQKQNADRSREKHRHDDADGKGHHRTGHPRLPVDAFELGCNRSGHGIRPRFPIDHRKDAATFCTAIGPGKQGGAANSLKSWPLRPSLACRTRRRSGWG